MKKWIALLALALSTQMAFAKGKIQNEDVKSLSELMTAVLTTTGNVSSSSPCLSSLGSITGLVIGLYVYDGTSSTHIQPGTTIVGIPGICSSGQVQMSVNGGANGPGDIITFGGQMSQLINDTKIYVTANGYNNTLDYVFTHDIPSNPLTTLGDIAYGGVGGAPTRLGIGGANQFLLSSGSVPEWGTPTVSANTFFSGPVSSSGAATFRTIQPADRPLYANSFGSSFSVPSNLDVFTCGGAAFTATLPSAIANPGRVLTFYKFDASFSNIITIAPTGGDTINGSGSSTHLVTFGETLTLYSPPGGTNWIITSRSYPKVPVSYAVNVNGTVSDPATGTVTLNSGFYRRISDDSIQLTWQYTQTSAGSAGSGVYIISIPPGLTINTTVNVPDNNGQSTTVGNGYLEANNGSFNSESTVYVYDSTHIAMLVGDSGIIWGSAGSFNYGAGNITKFSFTAQVSIAGWN